jgi:LacI family repressor for deo operon, udp, cdd, tsx, nupC, and nupG
MEAIDRLGLENRPEWTIRDFNDMESLRKQIIAMTKLPERPTALFCHNDQLARSVIDILNSIGLNVPEDISVIGYDDDQFAVSASPALTTIHHPRYLLGKEAVRMIYEDYNGKTSIYGREKVIPANLVVRGSTGPVNINLPEFQF